MRKRRERCGGGRAGGVADSIRTACTKMSKNEIEKKCGKTSKIEREKGGEGGRER